MRRAVHDLPAEPGPRQRHHQMGQGDLGDGMAAHLHGVQPPLHQRVHFL